MNKLLRTLTVLALSVLAAQVPMASVAAQDGPPTSEYAPDAVLVQFAPGVEAEVATAAELATSGDIIKQFSLVPGLTLYASPPRCGRDTNYREVARGSPALVYAEPDYSGIPYRDDTQRHSMGRTSGR